MDERSVEMTLTTKNVYFDMYDRDIYADPYPVYRGSARRRRSTSTSRWGSTR